MRLFVALQIPGAVRESLAALRNRLCDVSSDLRWVRPENFHVTLKFIGEASSEELQGIADELRGVRPDGAVQADFRGLGCSWELKRGGVFWTTMEGSASVKMLAAQIDRRLERLGIRGEDRAFLPHVTLARFKSSTSLPAIRGAVNEYAGRELGSMRAEEFHLIESKLGPGGSKYSTLASFRFAMAANA
jgi:RNA 2',3'-cyclic 3'-phosphodiesterase